MLLFCCQGVIKHLHAALHLPATRVAGASMGRLQRLQHALPWLLMPWCLALLLLEGALCSISWRAGRALIPAPWSVLGISIAVWAPLLLLLAASYAGSGGDGGSQASSAPTSCGHSSWRLAVTATLALFNCGLSVSFYVWFAMGPALRAQQLQADFPRAVAAMQRLINEPEASGECHGRFQLHADRLCTLACGGKGGSGALGGCFQRVRNMCLAADRVQLCSEGRTAGTDELVARGQFIYDHMAFQATRHRDGWLPFVYRTCQGMQLHAVRGTSFIAAESNRVNPDHEGEKVLAFIGAVGWQQLDGQMFWYSSRDRITPLWSGALDIVFGNGSTNSSAIGGSANGGSGGGGGSDSRVHWRSIPSGSGEPDHCYEDAILLDSPGSRLLLPGTNATRWFRDRVFAHCGAVVPAVTPADKRQLVVLDRAGSRHFANRCGHHRLAF